MERLAINERIAAARERVEAEGRKWGRPSRLTDHDRAKVAALKREGRTVREIAVAMKIPRSTVARAFKTAAAADASTAP
jgi:DNA invertase Pin-like site-specific DNA recombinase